MLSLPHVVQESERKKQEAESNLKNMEKQLADAANGQDRVGAQLQVSFFVMLSQYVHIHCNFYDKNGTSRACECDVFNIIEVILGLFIPLLNVRNIFLETISMLEQIFLTFFGPYL